MSEATEHTLNEIPWVKAREKAGEDLEAAWEFDRRGLQLSCLLIALGLYCWAFTTRQELGDIGLSIAIVAAIVSPWLIWQGIKYTLAVGHYWQSRGGFVLGFALVVVFSVAVVGLLLLVVLFLFTFFITVGSALAIPSPVAALFAAYRPIVFGLVGLVGFGLVFGVSVAVASVGARAVAVAGAGAGILAAGIAFGTGIISADGSDPSGIAAFFAIFSAAFPSVPVLIVARLISRASRSHARAKRNEGHISSSFLLPSDEPTGGRDALRDRCQTPTEDSGGSLTLGVTGRRGLGKTNLLRLLLKNHAAEEDPAAPAIEKGDLNDPDLVARHRVRTTGLFVQAPTDFGEMSFLAALLEQLAQRINQRLAALLPDVRPCEVERELEEKRRRLRRVHGAYPLLAALVIAGTGWSYWQSGTPDPLLDPFRPQPASVTTAPPAQASSRLYRAMSDSLADVLEPRLQQIEYSLEEVAQLLNPDITPESWNKTYNINRLGNDFVVSTTWDSLRRVAAGPLALEMDALRARATCYRQRLDSVAAVEARYEAARDSLRALRSMVRAGDYPWWTVIAFYAIIVGFPVAFSWIWLRTREGTKAFRRSEYDAVRDEIALYERTEELLERLTYHMTFGERRQASIEPPGWLAGWLFKLSGRFSREVIRKRRPYTVLSLVEEYRDYVQDVRFYLNHALEEDERIEEEKMRLVIAIDELDKVLDTDRLHEMLKSLKAVFEIEDVSYLLSISEDALGTYRLRHMQTKNEVDSAFTHIFNVPPMDAEASLRFYRRTPEEQGPGAQGQEGRPVPPRLLPLAIVLGGGVPRDMHRLAQMLHVRTVQQSAESEEAASPPSPCELLEELYEEDQDAAADLFRQDDCLGASWRQSLVARVKQPWPEGEEEAANRLEALQRLDVEVFEQENPCSGEAAQQAFHRIQLLLYGAVVKGYVYHRLSSLPPPETAEQVESRIDELEPLREAIFDLASDPLGVWERLKGNA